jgi:hypothetical protein
MHPAHSAKLALGVCRPCAHAQRASGFPGSAALPIRKCDRDRRSFFLNVEVEAFKKYVLPGLSHFLIGGGRSITKYDRHFF